MKWSIGPTDGGRFQWAADEGPSASPRRLLQRKRTSRQVENGRRSAERDLRRLDPSSLGSISTKNHPRAQINAEGRSFGPASPVRAGECEVISGEALGKGERKNERNRPSQRPTSKSRTVAGRARKRGRRRRGQSRRSRRGAFRQS